MSNFALDTGSSAGDIISGLNYALANLGNSSGTTNTAANVLVANIQTGNISTTYSNTAGYSTTNVVSYLYQFMDVAFANSATGAAGFTIAGPAYANYYGLHNTSTNTVSTNPVDYSWFQVAGGFGATRKLYYQTLGGRQLNLAIGTAAPDITYAQTQPNTPINLDSISTTQNNQVIIESAYLLSNIAPGTPSGGFYNFASLTLTPPDQPVQWTNNLPSVTANANVWISQTQFIGNSISNVAPATTWTSPSVFASGFNGNTGAQGQRGFVSMGYVVTLTDPTGYNDSQYTAAFQASRSNTTPPIGLGFNPISGDTAQFFYQNPLNPSNDVTIVKQYDGTNWNTVVGSVISGNLFVTQSINASRLNANDIYAINIQSTGANIGNVASTGYWLQANTGSASFAGTVTIGNNLTVGNNAVVGNNFSIGTNLSVGASATIGSNLTVGIHATIGANLSVGDSAVIGSNLSVGNSAVIGSNLSVGDSAVIGSNLSVGIHATIGANLSVGNSAVIGSNLSVGDTATIGANLSVGIHANIGANLSVGDSTVIGNNLSVGNSAVIGSNLSVGNSAVIGSNLSVGNSAVIGSTLSVGAHATIGANLSVGDSAVIGSNLSVGDTATIGSNLTVGAHSTIGANLSVGNSATIGANLSVGAHATIGANLSVGDSTVIGNNLSVGASANIGANLTVGNNAVIGGNINISGLISNGNLNANTVSTTQITDNSVTTSKIQANSITGNLIQANTIQGNSIVAGTITSTQLSADAIVVGNITSAGTTLGNVNATGYWLSNTNGAARFGGNTSIGNNLTIGNNAVIGRNLTVGNNVVIGGNLNVSGLITSSAFLANTVTTVVVSPNNISTSIFTSTLVQDNYSISGSTVYYYNSLSTGLTTTYTNQQVLVNAACQIYLTSFSGTNPPQIAVTLYRIFYNGVVTQYDELVSQRIVPLVYSGSNWICNVNLTALNFLPTATFPVGTVYNFTIGAHMLTSVASGGMTFSGGTVAIQNLLR